MYALKKFYVPAFCPCFLNISFIVGIVFFRLYFANFILVVCVLLAGLLELMFSYFFIWHNGFRPKINLIKAFSDKDIFKMLKLFLPRAWSAAVYHLNIFIDTIFSSLSWIVGQGAMAAIYYANRIIQFPLALIALSVSRVAIVDFSRFHKDGNINDLKKLFVFSFQNIMVFIIPISMVFISIPKTIIDVLFFRGEFGHRSLELTTSVLFFYSFGLFFFCAIKLMVNTFYSLKDTVTPAKIASCSLGLNIVLNAVLIFPLGVGGIALASSLAAAFNFLLLCHRLCLKIGPIQWQSIFKEAAKLLIVGLILGLVSKEMAKWSFTNKYVCLSVVLCVDFVLFLLLGIVLNVRQMGFIRRWIRNLVIK